MLLSEGRPESAYLEVVKDHETKDHVFLLSIQEAERYFTSDDDRLCKGSAYCFAQGAFEANDKVCSWWLRTPGEGHYKAAFVDTEGIIYVGGTFVNFNNALRPAMWLKIEP